MKLPLFCIKKPVFTVVLSLVLVIFGILGYTQIQERYFPKLFRPTLDVSTTYIGASAKVVEQTITDPLEAVLAGTNHLERMSSLSSEGQSDVTLHFKDISKTDFVIAQSQILQEISSVNLPEDAKPKIYSSGSGNQIMVVGFTDTGKTEQSLSNYVKTYLKKQIEEIPGVGRVSLWSSPSALRVSLNPVEMAELGVTTSDVVNLLRSDNTLEPAGYLENKSQILFLNTTTALSNVKAFQNLEVKKIGNRIVRLKNIATVYLGKQYALTSNLLINGKTGAALSIFASDDANPIALGKTIRKTLAQMQTRFPPGMQAHVVFDLPIVFQHSVNEVYLTVLEAILLVVLVTFLFLGNWRATLIPVVTIPVCLISVFSVIYLLGYSINVLTLLALVLAVGLVVDDAIVVLENSYRHIESGMTPMDAAKKGSKEISFAVIGITISLFAVYAPTSFLKANAAIILREFAFTLGFCVLISGFVALTLSPMMCARFLKPHKGSGFELFLDRTFSFLRRHYKRILGYSLRHKIIVVILFIVCLFGGAYEFHGLPGAFLPKSEAGFIFVFLQAPDSASSAYTEKYAKQVTKQIKAMPAVSSFLLTNAGGAANSRIIFALLKPTDKRKLTTAAVATKINGFISNTPELSGGAQAINLNSSSVSFGNGQVQFLLMGLGTYRNLQTASNNFVAALKKYPGVTDINPQLKFNNQQYNIAVNRNLAVELGVPVSEITGTIATMIGSYTLESSSYKSLGESYPVVVQLPVKSLKDFAVLQKIYVRNNAGKMLPISRFLTITPSLGLKVRQHYNQMRAAEIDLNIAPGYSLGQVVHSIINISQQELPAGMQIAFTGQAKRLLDGNDLLLWVFILGLVFIYLVLAALFESFLDPLIILFTVPLCVVGAVVVLKLAGGTLNLYTGIGLVTLIGLVSKHGVLITQFANQRRCEGLDILTAVLDAASVRLRPILMTTATMVLGAMPLVLATGPGSNGRMQIGVVIVAGLLIGTFFSLFIVPTAYIIVAKFKKVH